MIATNPAETDAAQAHGHAYGDETRQAILVAAMKVIAENGVAGASLRAINVAAGCRNASAAHYHYGNKNALIEAALRLIMARVSVAQEPLLAALEERVRYGRPVSIREGLEAAYLPYLALLGQPEFGPTAAKFMSRVLIESDAQLQKVVNEVVAPMMQRCLVLAKAGAPHVPEPIMKLRILISVTNVIHGAGDLAMMSNSPFGDMTMAQPLGVLHGLFDYITAAVSAPASPLTAADESRMTATLFPG